MYVEVSILSEDNYVQLYVFVKSTTAAGFIPEGTRHGCHVLVNRCFLVTITFVINSTLIDIEIN